MVQLTRCTCFGPGTCINFTRLGDPEC